MIRWLTATSQLALAQEGGEGQAHDHRHWASEADARRDVFRWIAFYNHRRRHSTLGYLSPADYEQSLTPTTLHQIAA